jgi:hypothetical protein
MSSLHTTFRGDTSRFSSNPTFELERYVEVALFAADEEFSYRLADVVDAVTASASSQALYFSVRRFLYCFSDSVSLTKGWFNSSGHPSLSDGFLLSSPFKKALNSLDMLSG